MFKNLKILALITARSGSKSVKNKNILGLEGYCGESNIPCPVGHQYSGQNMCYGWIDNE